MRKCQKSPIILQKSPVLPYYKAKEPCFIQQRMPQLEVIQDKNPSCCYSRGLGGGGGHGGECHGYTCKVLLQVYYKLIVFLTPVVLQVYKWGSSARQPRSAKAYTSQAPSACDSLSHCDTLGTAAPRSALGLGVVISEAVTLSPSSTRNAAVTPFRRKCNCGGEPSSGSSMLARAARPLFFAEACGSEACSVTRNDGPRVDRDLALEALGPGLVSSS